MQAFNVKLPPELNERVRQAAFARRWSKAEFMRQAAEHLLNDIDMDKFDGTDDPPDAI